MLAAATAATTLSDRPHSVSAEAVDRTNSKLMHTAEVFKSEQNISSDRCTPVCGDRCEQRRLQEWLNMRVRTMYDLPHLSDSMRRLEGTRDRPTTSGLGVANSALEWVAAPDPLEGRFISRRRRRGARVRTRTRSSVASVRELDDQASDLRVGTLQRVARTPSPTP